MFRKNNKSIVLFNDRDIAGFIESCCCQSTVIQKKGHQRDDQKTEQ